MTKDKTKTNLQLILDDIGMSQSELSILSGLEKYQVSLIASGTRTDCMIYTANKICKALSKRAKIKITLDAVFGGEGLSRPFRMRLRKRNSREPLDEISPPNTPTFETQEK